MKNGFPGPIGAFVPVLCLLAAQYSRGEESNPTITLDTLLQMARSSHPEFQSENLSPEIAQEVQSGLEGSQDWNLAVRGETRYVEPIPSPVPGTATRDTRYGLTAELSKSDWNSGSQFRLGASSGYGDLLFGTNAFTQFQNRVFAEYSISLLRNARGVLDRLQFDLAAFDIEIAQIESNENKEAFLLELGSLFLNWALLHEEVRILDKRLAIAREEVERTRRMRADNLIEEVDVLRTEDSERAVKQARLLVVSQLEAVRVQLATRMGDSSILEMIPRHNLYRLREDLSDGLVAKDIVENTRPLRQLTVAGRQLERALEGFENSEKASLDIVAGGALSEGDDSYSDSLLVDRPEAYLVLRWSRSLGNRSAKADVRRTSLQILQLRHQLEGAGMELQSIARALVAQMDELENVLVLNQEQMESAARRTAEELRLYNQGRGEMNFVLSSRDNEARAEFTYAENAAAYQQLDIQLRELLDELL